MQFHYPANCMYFLFNVSLMVVAGLSGPNVNELILAHNFYRRLFVYRDLSRNISNMNILVWDPQLALEASYHLTCDSWNVSLPNTNIGRYRRQPYFLTNAVRKWYQQKESYLQSERECFPWDSCPHLRNLVNAKHTAVGCAVRFPCANNTVVLACKYRGGIAEEFGFQYGRPCTGCGGESNFCKDSLLCAPCNPRTQRCDCKKTCNRERVGYGNLDPNSCTCNCQYGHGPNCDQPCMNRPQYVDFDVCSMLSPALCDDPDSGQIYREFCPAVCTCRPYPEENHQSPSPPRTQS